VFNVTKVGAENMTHKLNFTCKNDYNKLGGALGNVECKISGVFREKKVLPLPPAPEEIKE
jgi:hypothetical protein